MKENVLPETEARSFFVLNSEIISFFQDTAEHYTGTGAGTETISISGSGTSTSSGPKFSVKGGKMKPGFVMYFENCQVLRDLPDAQYAAVMRALAEYAERLAEGQEGKTYLEQQKALLPREEARILDIMAGSVRRDHRKYQETIDRRSRKQPWAADREKTTASAPAMDDDVWKYV